MIKTADLIAKFEYALANNWGYIWGKAGEVWTAAAQAAATREQTKQFGSKWIGHHVADCSGMFSWAFKELGGYMYHGSNTMYLKYCDQHGTMTCGKRDDGQHLKPGTAVFCYNEDERKYSHVGLYVGSGNVIEAAGTKSGVIRSKVSNRKWGNWGELKGVDYSDAAPDPQPEPGPICPTIRKGSSGEFVIVLQEILVDLAYDIGPSGVDGKFGTMTEAAVKRFQAKHGLTADGIVGPKTWAQLLIYQGDEPESYSVTIKGLTKAEADELIRKYPSATMKED